MNKKWNHFNEKHPLNNHFNEKETKSPLDVGSSETIRKTTIPQVSPHRPVTRKPRNEREIGSFLAGLIDGDGHWSAIPQLVISFDEREKSLAHYVKKTLGYGQVSPVKGKRALKYVCAHREGLRRCALLSAPYLRNPDKWAHYEERCRIPLNLPITPLCTDPLLGDWWLAGFLLGDGSISCRLVERPPRRLETRFLIRIDHQKSTLLHAIQRELGGSIGFRASQNTYYYSSVSFFNAVRWINYLDKAFLMGVKMTTYVIWRRAYVLVQEKRHRTPGGELSLRRMCQQMRLFEEGLIG